jgi:diguanylate cyclase (GGDEF)-like protein
LSEAGADCVAGDAAGPDNPLGPEPGAFCMVPLASRGTVRGVLYVDRDQTAEIEESHLRMLLDFAAQAAVAMENARLYGETKRLLDETREIAATDPLTGLANRRALDALAERELHNAGRYGGLLALLLLDLDDLKAINDRDGHQAGDDALLAFAAALRAGARRGDLVARYGGDEFVLLMAQCGRSGAESALRRLYVTLGERGIRCSAGVSVFPNDGTDLRSLFEAADRALYQAKSAGKNQFRVAG